MTNEEALDVRRAYHGQRVDSDDAYDAIIYHLFASEYGWTVQDVDNTPAKMIFMLIEAMREASESEAMSSRLMKRLLK